MAEYETIHDHLTITIVRLSMTNEVTQVNAAIFYWAFCMATICNTYVCGEYVSHILCKHHEAWAVVHFVLFTNYAIICGE